ncbi:sensor histidine kinase [Paenibacillaceae bacterium WGS1546]|uniref:sensor histidine kinase n=1 Tax=Cohnella sp. WGS1546 TaxID=3366810 RepID=UPI00372D0DF3
MKESNRRNRDSGRRRFRPLDLYRENKEHHRRMKELRKPFPHARLWGLAFIMLVLVGISACWGIAYGLIDVIFRYAYPEYGHSLLRQYLTVLLAFWIFALGIAFIRIVASPLRRQMEWFLQMMNAMKQLAKGNFNVNVETNPRYMGQFAPLAASLNELASELNQMEQMRQEFISNVSHEIQSPLTSIAGFARALKSDDLSPERRRRYLEIIETESKRLSRMSDNLLKLTSLESNRHPFDQRHYRLDRQIRGIILSCEPLWREKRIEMDVELPVCSVYADEDLMSQVWINLLHNAIKFAPEGGQIRVVLARKNDLLRVTVANNGPAISESALPHLFERFYKEDKSRERAAGGSGLGLSIVKKIVDMHGGEAYAANQIGSGAMMTVDLPAGSR